MLRFRGLLLWLFWVVGLICLACWVLCVCLIALFFRICSLYVGFVGLITWAVCDIDLVCLSFVSGHCFGDWLCSVLI